MSFEEQLKHLLREEYLDTVATRGYDPVDIYKNQPIKALEVRGFISQDGDFYVWDAGDSEHRRMEKDFFIPKGIKLSWRLMIKSGANFTDIDTYSSPTKYLNEISNSLKDKIFKRLYDWFGVKYVEYNINNPDDLLTVIYDIKGKKILKSYNSEETAQFDSMRSIINDVKDTTGVVLSRLPEKKPYESPFSKFR